MTCSAERKSDAAMGERAARTPYVGRPLPRLEDRRLVAGRGRFTDDVALEGQVHAVFVRSPHAHAGILSIDTAKARALAGVIAVFTAGDYAAAGGRGIAHVATPASTFDVREKAFSGPGLQTPAELTHLPLAGERVRFVGEPVVMVVAESRRLAEDAAESVMVEYAVLPAVTDALAALGEGAPQLHDEVPGNLALDTVFGDRAACEAACAGAHLVVRQVFRNQRVASAQMEPRAAIGAFDAAQDTCTIVTGSQGALRIAGTIAGCLGLPPSRVRAITGDVGGAFGLLSNVYPEQVMVTFAARELRRPVKWTGDRSQGFLADYQGRDMVTDARLAVAADGKILALAVTMTGNVGCRPVTYVPLSNAYRVTPTVYDVPLAMVAIRGVLTNTVPTAPFRGAGRPEATFVIERLLDIAARRLGIDRIALRRRNLVQRAQLPYRSATGLVYDSGDFPANMAAVMKLADWDGFAARRRDAARRGRLAGIGLANYVESPVGAPSEYVRLRVGEDRVEAAAGTQSSGQGHETTFAQVLADRLGIHPHDVRLVTGDSAVIPAGGGTHSDRSMRLAGTLLVEASGRIIEQASRVFAALARCPESDVSFGGGLFESPRSNVRLDLFDVARAIERDAALPAALRAPLTAEARFTGRIPAYPTGSAVCEVEIDPETGALVLTRYASVDDCGQPINPLILHGQVHGGIVQGAGQAFFECVANEAASGQVLTGSFMDYAIPRAGALPPFRVDLTEDPTQNNPLRVKGGGEAGITPSLAVIMNAVVDALSPCGVEHLDMPATPARVWEAIRMARAK